MIMLDKGAGFTKAGHLIEGIQVDYLLSDHDILEQIKGQGMQASSYQRKTTPFKGHTARNFTSLCKPATD
jgi:hypothetical protein